MYTYCVCIDYCVLCVCVLCVLCVSVVCLCVLCVSVFSKVEIGNISCLYGDPWIAFICVCV